MHKQTLENKRITNCRGIVGTNTKLRCVQFHTWLVPSRLHTGDTARGEEGRGGYRERERKVRWVHLARWRRLGTSQIPHIFVEDSRVVSNESGRDINFGRADFALFTSSFQGFTVLLYRWYTIPKSQNIPVMPAGHKHLNPPCLFTQPAPFLHGLYGRHSLTSVENRQIGQF